MLSWNTAQLLEAGSNGSAPERTSIEFHYLSYRELYDSTIISADRHHSSAGEWVCYGDHHWYTVVVVTRPVYSLPQELCLSFDCFWRTDKIGSGTITGPPADKVALEFGMLLSLLVREPLQPLGERRNSGKPVRFFDSYPHISRPIAFRNRPAVGVDSRELREILVGLSKADGRNSGAVIAAARLYHAALSLSTYDVSTAYFSLVSAIECLAGHYFQKKSFPFGDVEKFKRAGSVIDKISPQISDSTLIDELKREIVSTEHFVWQKFRDFIEAFLPEEFWLPDDSQVGEYEGLKVEKKGLRRVLRKAYDARSAFAHTGEAFPAHVEVGIGEWVNTTAALHAFELAASGSKKSFVPLFVWFERLTHLVIREYLIREIAPELVRRRDKSAEERARMIGVIKSLPEEARASLKRLADWTIPFLNLTIIGPMAANREWALDQASIERLLSAGLIGTKGASNDQHSWIKDREVGEIIGEFFYGVEKNPFKGNTVLQPKGWDRLV